MTVACYWCGHPDVTLGKKCPGCDTQLEVLTMGPRTPINDMYAVALKEIVVRQDRLVLDWLESYAREVPAPAFENFEG